jgi:hypothetical protein
MPDETHPDDLDPSEPVDATAGDLKEPGDLDPDAPVDAVPASELADDVEVVDNPEYTEESADPLAITHADLADARAADDANEDTDAGDATEDAQDDAEGA